MLLLFISTPGLKLAMEKSHTSDACCKHRRLRRTAPQNESSLRNLAQEQCQTPANQYSKRKQCTINETKTIILI